MTAVSELYCSRGGGEPFSYLLETSLVRDGAPNKSIFGIAPAEILISYPDESYLISGGYKGLTGNPLALLDDFLATYVFGNTGKIAIGYLSYELKNSITDIFNHPHAQLQEINIPEMIFCAYDSYVTVDEDTGTTVSYGGHRGNPRSMRTATDIIMKRFAFKPMQSEMSIPRARYLESIRQIKELIRDGYVYEVNLSNRFMSACGDDHFRCYETVTRRHPCRYGAFLPCGAFTIISNSPEEFLRKEGQRITTRPIKGTRKRNSSDTALNDTADELMKSEKEDAELAMIVDLERNDLNRICKAGTVKVACAKRHELHPTVHHLSAEVIGELKPGASIGDILAATFPGGSVTGAPKSTAIEIIQRFEPTTRGIYTGSIGYVTSDGDFSLNIAIRTAVLAGGVMLYNSGGAIVYDSDPEMEYDEILAKAAAFRSISPATRAFLAVEGADGKGAAGQA